MTNFFHIAEAHFYDLKTTLENKVDKKAYILIIEYLLNFLGCVSLAAIKSKDIKDLSRNENISDLTAGQWVNFILRSLDLIENSKVSEQIAANFLINERQLKPYIERWLQLRNELSHDFILIDDKQLEKLLGNRLLNIVKDFEFFTKGLNSLTKDFQHLLKTEFFHISDNTLYIYAGIDDDYRIKYKHFRHQPLIIKVNDFPLTYKKVFISLEQTPYYILVPEDEIITRIRTMHRRSGLKFQLWVNGIIAKEKKEDVVNGSLVRFDTANLQIQDDNNNSIEVKVLINNTEIASDLKNVFIYNDIPKPMIKLDGTDEKKFPVDKTIELKLRVEPKFEIKEVRIKTFSPDESLELLSQSDCVYNKDFSISCVLQVIASTVGEHIIMCEVTYSDKRRKPQKISKNFSVIATPDFYKPPFVSDRRYKYIELIRSNKKHFLITGEGGIGKSRLIQEAFEGSEYKEITFFALSQIHQEIAKAVAYQFEDKKEDKKRDEIMQLLERMKGVEREYIFWFKDSHEIQREDEHDFLKTLLEKTTNTNIRFIIESRDKSWGHNAEKLIKKLMETDIEHITLVRLSDDELRKVIDNIFMPNKFEGYIEDIIKLSDGIVYILLTTLKKLYDKNYFAHNDYIWEIREDSDIKQGIQSFGFNNVIKVDIEDTLKILDANGLGIQARELLKYLCIKEIPVSIVESLLSISSSHVHYLLEVLESNYIIKCYEKFPRQNVYLFSKEERDEIRGEITDGEYVTHPPKSFRAISFHHQLKENYFKEKYLPDNIIPDYIVQLAMKYSYNYDFFNGALLKEEFHNLSKFNLTEKLDYLVYTEAQIPHRIIDVIWIYIDEISTEQAISYAEYALILMGQQIDRLMSEGFEERKREIEEFFEQKGIADNDWLELRADLEYDSIRYYLDYLLQKEQGSVVEKTWSFLKREEYTPNSEIQIFKASVQLTSYFIDNQDVLKKIYDRIDTLRIYLAELEYEWDDVNFSWIHLTGIFLSINNEKIGNRKDEYTQLIDSILSNISMKKTVKKSEILLLFIEFHRHILKDNLRLTEALNNAEKKLLSFLPDGKS